MYQVRTQHGLENLPYWGSLSPLLFPMGKALELMSSMGFWSRKVKVLVAQSCLTLWDPMDCSPPGSSVHGILQTRILEWAVIYFSRGSSRPRDQTHISCIGRQILYHRATWEALLVTMKSNKREDSYYV